MKTLTEAVKACGGVWPGGPREDMWIIREPDGVKLIQIYNSGPYYTRPEFEAEAARLSGKPGWGEAPEGSNARVQDDMGYWHFGKFPAGSQYPVPTERGNWESGDGEWLTGASRLKGTVLGDWRDTLERRPEVEAKTENTHWTPAIGDVCHIEEWTSNTGWILNEYKYRVDFIGKRHVVATTVETPRDVERVFNEVRFIPLKSDRERWCERVETLTDHLDECSMNQVYACIYDALRDGVLPVPE